MSFLRIVGLEIYDSHFENVGRLTLIRPPSFSVNCDAINIHEHNLHMIIIF